MCGSVLCVLQFMDGASFGATITLSWWGVGFQVGSLRPLIYNHFYNLYTYIDVIYTHIYTFIYMYLPTIRALVRPQSWWGGRGLSGRVFDLCVLRFKEQLSTSRVWRVWKWSTLSVMRETRCALSLLLKVVRPATSFLFLGKSPLCDLKQTFHVRTMAHSKRRQTRF